MEKRFFVHKSMIYGITVYDRVFQVPAFEAGAECNMREEKALFLAMKLNAAEKRRLINCHDVE